MDKYAIMCMFILIALCLWHTGMSALVFAFTVDSRVTPDMWLARLDRYVLLFALTTFIMTHLILLIWLYFGPLKHRRMMWSVGAEYYRALSEKKKQKKKRFWRSKSQQRRASLYPHVRIEK
jgi:hypothetical protein